MNRPTFKIVRDGRRFDIMKRDARGHWQTVAGGQGFATMEEAEAELKANHVYPPSEPDRYYDRHGDRVTVHERDS